MDRKEIIEGLRFLDHILKRLEIEGLEEDIPIRGEVNFKRFDENGNLTGDWTYKNTIVYAGNDLIRDAVGQASGQPAGAQWIAIGTGTTAADPTDTALESETARGQGTYGESETGAGKKDKWTLQYTFGAGVGTGDITEAGCLNAASAGTLLCRQTFTAIPKGASDSIQVTWTFTITNP